MLARKTVSTVATASPSAALHGRGRGSLIPPSSFGSDAEESYIKVIMNLSCIFYTSKRAIGGIICWFDVVRKASLDHQRSRVPTRKIWRTNGVMLLSTLPTLATTVTFRVIWAILWKAMLGLVRRVIPRRHTVCTSMWERYTHRPATIVVTVTPYAAPRSRVDSTMRTPLLVLVPHLTRRARPTFMLVALFTRTFKFNRQMSNPLRLSLGA